MIEREKLEKELNAFFARKFKAEADFFDVVVRPKGDVSADHVQFLADLVVLALRQQNFNPVSNLCIAVTNFAYAFNEKEIENELKILMRGKKEKGTKAVSLPNMERALMKDYFSPSKLGKRFKAGSFGTRNFFTLGDLNAKLMQDKALILSRFNEIYLRHNITVPLKVLDFDKKDNDGMPVI